jgi:hypothetical protein
MIWNFDFSGVWSITNEAKSDTQFKPTCSSLFETYCEQMLNSFTPSNLVPIPFALSRPSLLVEPEVWEACTLSDHAPL